MELIDSKKLRKLMVIQDVSQRELAIAAGYKTHSYLGRLLRGDVKTLNTDPALRIAHYLGVPSDDLFLTKMSTDSGSNVQRKVTRQKIAA
jgi:transcriptional regulator with XRE-family HTH domain